MIHTMHSIVGFLLIIPTISYFIEVVDMQNQRKGKIFGTVSISHFQRDNKPAMMLYRASMQQNVGDPPLSLQEIDIMHKIQAGIYRFQPQLMQPTQLGGNIEHVQTVTFKSKKRPGWLFHFYFSQAIRKTIEQIIDFVNMHQTQRHIDLFQQLPDDLKEKLRLEQEQDVRALQKKNGQFYQEQTNYDL